MRARFIRSRRLDRRPGRHGHDRLAGSSLHAAGRPRPSRRSGAQRGGPEVVPGCQVRPVRPLGRLLAPGQGRVGHGPRQAADRANTPSSPPRFNPTRFDAEAWVKLAKAAGAAYITVTSKHHDGFCMFDSKLTDYDVVDATPYHADPSRRWRTPAGSRGSSSSSTTRCSTGTIPDYFPLGKTGRSAGREGRGDWKRYVAYYQGQVRSSAPITARSAGSGSTAGGTAPTPNGTWRGRTG